MKAKAKPVVAKEGMNLLFWPCDYPSLTMATVSTWILNAVGMKGRGL